MDSENPNKRIPYENLKSSQIIRAALHRDVQDICKETCHNIGWDISSPAIELVTELVYKKLSIYGSDLMAFAKHANRTTIKTEDVKLLARRCPSLVTHLNNLAPSTITKKRKRNDSIVPHEIQSDTNGNPRQKENGFAASTYFNKEMVSITPLPPSASKAKRRKSVSIEPRETARKDSAKKKGSESPALNLIDLIDLEEVCTSETVPATPSFSCHPAIPRDIFRNETPKKSPTYTIPELIAYRKNNLEIIPVYKT